LNPETLKPFTGGDSMKQLKASLFFGVMLMIGLHVADYAYADKASVAIEAPGSAANGAEITIKVTVTHSADNMFHHVDWAYLMINGKEVERWEYSWSNRPPAATFTKEIKYKVNGPLEVKAEANCNIHGSKGPAIAQVKMQ
jgi:desulfoferrodoxin (superoxide reductase-like protein)